MLVFLRKRAIYLKIIFMGTPLFATISLESLISYGYDIVAVFTNPDKPKGRGYKLESPPVKISALKYDIPVFQPKSLKDPQIVDLIKNFKPDLIVVIAYGKILPKQILDIPKYGCVNIHASLLPKYRGAAPIQWSIINGDKYSGVTSMFMNEKLDSGDIIIKDKVLINPDETSEELMERLAPIAAKNLLKTVNLIDNNSVIFTPQNENDVTFAPILSKSLSSINFNMPALTVHNLIRGINPWPVAKIIYKDKLIKVFRSKIVDLNSKKGVPGEIIDEKNFIVACQNGTIEFLEIQPENGKKMLSKDFLLGHKIKIGDIIQSPSN